MVITFMKRIFCKNDRAASLVSERIKKAEIDALRDKQNFYGRHMQDLNNDWFGLGYYIKLQAGMLVVVTSALIWCGINYPHFLTANSSITMSLVGISMTLMLSCFSTWTVQHRQKVDAVQSLLNVETELKKLGETDNVECAQDYYQHLYPENNKFLIAKLSSQQRRQLSQRYQNQKKKKIVAMIWAFLSFGLLSWHIRYWKNGYTLRNKKRYNITSTLSVIGAALAVLIIRLSGKYALQSAISAYVITVIVLLLIWRWLVAIATAPEMTIKVNKQLQKTLAEKLLAGSQQ